MARHLNKSTFNTSFGHTSFRSQLETTIPTVIGAIKKLKQEEDKVIQAHKRYRVLNRHISKEQINGQNKEKLERFHSAVKYSAEMDKEIKKQTERKKMEELKLRFSLNMKKKQENKKMIDSVKKSFQQVNHKLYEQIRKKKIQNDKIINRTKLKYVEEKVHIVKRASEEKDIRRKSIQNFYDSRVSTFKKSKEEEVFDLLRKSETKHKYLDVLVSRNSRVREFKLNTSRDHSTKSLDNPEKQTLNITKD